MSVPDSYGPRNTGDNSRKVELCPGNQSPNGLRNTLSITDVQKTGANGREVEDIYGNVSSLQVIN